MILTTYYRNAREYTSTLYQAGSHALSECYHIGITIVHEFSAMVSCGFNKHLGETNSFHYFGANPDDLSEDDQDKPAIILLHGAMHNQSGWLPLLKRLQQRKIGPVYTLNYAQNTRQQNLCDTIEKVKQQYGKFGKQPKLILVGHSLGGIVAVEYAFGTSQVSGVSVNKVITVASRLKIMEGSRFRGMYEDIIPIVNQVYQQFQQSSEKHKLHAISAKRDWLVPIQSTQLLENESSLISNRYLVEDYSHLSVLYAQETEETIIKILSDS